MPSKNLVEVTVKFKTFVADDGAYEDLEEELGRVPTSEEKIKLEVGRYNDEELMLEETFDGVDDLEVVEVKELAG